MPGNENLVAPLRVFPGRLSVSRTFGDIEAKLPKYKGKPNVIIAVPDVRCIKLANDIDFILIGCDGIFDKLSSEDAGKIVWKRAKAASQRGCNIHEICGECVVGVLQEAMEHRSLDNVTVVMIAFKNFKRSLKLHLERKQQTKIAEHSLSINPICSNYSNDKNVTLNKQIVNSYNTGKKISIKQGSISYLEKSPSGVILKYNSSFNGNRISSPTVDHSWTPNIYGKKTVIPSRGSDSYLAGKFAVQTPEASTVNFPGIKGLMDLSKKGKSLNI